MKFIKALTPFVACVAFAAPLAGCSDDSEDEGSTGGSGGDESCQTIAEIVSGSEDYSTLLAAAEKADLVGALTGGITVFAPDNAAFADLLAAIGAESLDDLTAEQLTPILTYHVVASEVDSTAAVEKAGSDDPLVGTLGGTAELALDGETLMIDSANVTSADIEACDGIIHGIDAVIVPSIADMVLSQANLSELKGLVEAAASTDTIVETLDSTANVTLFAPENDAISSLESAPDAETLDVVLSYHAYPGDAPVYAADALELMDADITMAAGGTVTVNGGEGVTLTDGQGNDSMVTVADLYASNGVLHIIDGVLLPAAE